MIKCPEGIKRNIKIPKYALERIKEYKCVVDCKYSYPIKGFPFEKCPDCKSKAFIVRVDDGVITTKKFPY